MKILRTILIYFSFIISISNILCLLLIALSDERNNTLAIIGIINVIFIVGGSTLGAYFSSIRFKGEEDE